VNRRRIRGAVAVAFALLSQHAAAQQAWYLMSRHGECSTITPAMRHRMADFPEVRTPEALVQALKLRKLDVHAERLSGARDGQWLLGIPSLGWTLLVVRENHCASFPNGPR